MDKLKTPTRRRRLSRIAATHLATAPGGTRDELSDIARTANAAIEAADDTKHDEILDQAEAALLSVPGVSELPELPPDPMPEQEVESMDDESQEEAKEEAKEETKDEGKGKAPSQKSNNLWATLSAVELATLALTSPHKLMAQSAPSYTLTKLLDDGDMFTREFEHTEYEEIASGGST